MRWPVFLVFALLALVLDRSLIGALEFNGVQPLSVATVAVFVALMAPKMTALWACWMLGLMVDLGSPMASDGAVHIIGPHALGFAFGGYLVVLIRSMVFRRRALTIGVMTVACMLAVSLIVVVVLVIRSWFEATTGAWPMDSATRALGHRFFVALYSGIIALPIGWMLVRTMPLWGFQSKTSRPVNWR